MIWFFCFCAALASSFLIGTITSASIATTDPNHHHSGSLRKKTTVTLNRSPPQPTMLPTREPRNSQSRHQSTSSTTHDKHHTASKASLQRGTALSRQSLIGNDQVHVTFQTAKHYKVDENVDPPVLPNDFPWQLFHSNNTIVAFYNLYIDNHGSYVNIANQQLDILNMTGLLSRLDAFYYVTVGRDYEKIMDPGLKKRMHATKPLNELAKQFYYQNETHRNTTYSNSNSTYLNVTAKPRDYTSLLHDNQLFLHLHNSIPAVDETLTLAYLYQFCHAHPKSIVLYFHDKGSFHGTLSNTYFRNFLDCYVLNPNCLDTLLHSDLDTCGLRFTPVPNMHYSGNFWWAKCSYVKTLVNPESMAFNQTFAHVTHSLSKWIVSSRRYLAEAWVGSGPRIKPADCMSHEIDGGNFLCWRGGNGIAIHQCPNHYKNYEKVWSQQDYSAGIIERLRQKAGSNNGTLSLGSSCGTAQVIVNPQYFIKEYEDVRDEAECGGADVVQEMKKRSYLWYGQEPIDYLNITKQLAVVDITSIPSPSIISLNKRNNNYLFRNGKVYDSKQPEYREATTMKGLPVINMSEFKLKLLRAST